MLCAYGYAAKPSEAEIGGTKVKFTTESTEEGERLTAKPPSSFALAGLGGSKFLTTKAPRHQGRTAASPRKTEAPCHPCSPC